MATEKQRAAARRNVKKAQAGAKSKQTLKNLPRKTRSALGRRLSRKSVLQRGLPMSDSLRR
jgi:hypothetical protein